MSADLNPHQFNTLAEVANAGYNTDEWKRWQQGECGTYAAGLKKLNPKLRVAAGDDGEHFYAYDKGFAYDSAGRHPMPYRGIEGQLQHVQRNANLDHYGEGPGWAADEDIQAAADHAQRHGILEGRYGRRAQT